MPHTVVGPPGDYLHKISQPARPSLTSQTSPQLHGRPRSSYSKKLCYQIEADAQKQNYDIMQMQEEKYGL